MRIAILVVIGVLCIAAAFMLTRAPQAHESAAFVAQLRVTVDAVERYQANPSKLTKVEAQREYDALRRLENSPEELNVCIVIQQYWFAAQIVAIAPTSEYKAKLQAASHDVSMVTIYTR
jgi:hypothetical protein